MRLPDVRERIPFKIMSFVPKHPSFEIGKRSERLGMFVGKDNTVSVEIFKSPTPPCAFGYGKHVWIEAVLEDDTPFIGQKTVVPDAEDDAREVFTTLFFVINTAVIQCNDISKRIEVIQVMKARINGRYALLSLAAIAPKLCHVDLAGLIRPTRIP